MFNSCYIGGVLIVLVGVFSGWCLYGKVEVGLWLKVVLVFGIVVLVWGLLWWFGSGSNEIDCWVWCIVSKIVGCLDILLYVVFVLLMVWVVYGLCCKFDWVLVEWFVLVLLLVFVLIFLVVIEYWVLLLLVGWGGLVWIVVVVLVFVLLCC